MAKRTADPTFAWEPLGRLLDDGIEALVRREWEEVAIDRDRMPLDLDWDEYQRMEDNGLFRCMGARLGGKLIGFSSFMTFRGHPHYRTTPHAMNDAIYVVPEHRGLTGLRLILSADRELQEWSAPKPVRVVYQAKDLKMGPQDSLEAVEALMVLEHEFGLKLTDGPQGDTLGAVLTWLGYKAFETSYGRFVG